MKILFTGASSFTGYWFVKELVSQGHDVTAIFQKDPHAYTGTRQQRVNNLIGKCSTLFNCPIASPSFLSLAANGYDLFCHHAADVTNYKSPSFNAAQALLNNTQGMDRFLPALKAHGCHHVLLTGSVFEQREGAGTEVDRAFSPYGLSKGLTSDFFRFLAHQHQMHLAKFVIPNPFGPYEEERFTHHLIKNWMNRKSASVSTPDYVRDNIHVSLLAKAYAHFAAHLQTGYTTLHPSGYVETQGEFTKRVAEAMRTRLDLPCEYVLEKQRTFAEPMIRTNTEKLSIPEWDEDRAWNDLAVFYKRGAPVKIEH